MVNDASVTGNHFGVGNPDVFLESRIDNKVLILDRAIGRDRERTVPHRDDSIGFTPQLPTACELNWIRQLR